MTPEESLKPYGELPPPFNPRALQEMGFPVEFVWGLPEGAELAKAIVPSSLSYLVCQGFAGSGKTAVALDAARILYKSGKVETIQVVRCADLAEVIQKKYSSSSLQESVAVWKLLRTLYDQVVEEGAFDRDAEEMRLATPSDIQGSYFTNMLHTLEEWRTSNLLILDGIDRFDGNEMLAKMFGFWDDRLGLGYGYPILMTARTGDAVKRATKNTSRRGHVYSKESFARVMTQGHKTPEKTVEAIRHVVDTNPGFSVRVLEASKRTNGDIPKAAEIVLTGDEAKNLLARQLLPLDDPKLMNDLGYQNSLTPKDMRDVLFTLCAAQMLDPDHQLQQKEPDDLARLVSAATSIDIAPGLITAVFEGRLAIYQRKGGSTTGSIDPFAASLVLRHSPVPDDFQLDRLCGALIQQRELADDDLLSAQQKSDFLQENIKFPGETVDGEHVDDLLTQAAACETQMATGNEWWENASERELWLVSNYKDLKSLKIAYAEWQDKVKKRRALDTNFVTLKKYLSST